MRISFTSFQEIRKYMRIVGNSSWNFRSPPPPDRPARSALVTRYKTLGLGDSKLCQSSVSERGSILASHLIIQVWFY